MGDYFDQEETISVSISIDLDDEEQATFDSMMEESKSLGDFDNIVDALNAVGESRQLSQAEEKLMEKVQKAIDSQLEEVAEELGQSFVDLFPKEIRIDF